MTKEELRRLQRRNDRYWKRREMRQRAKLYNKTVEELDTELGKQYLRVSKDLKRLFIEAVEEVKGKDGVIQPSDLYNSDRYYKLMNEVNDELSKLAQKQTGALESNLTAIYEEQSLADRELLGGTFGLYDSVNKEAARLVVNEIWCDDGKDLSNRIWRNKEWLMQRLEESLFDFVSRGQPTMSIGYENGKPKGLMFDLISDQTGVPIEELTNTLDDDFREAYNNARRLVRTETARVQNRATQDRYRDAGFTKYRILAEPDCCDVCADLAEQVFDIDELVIPAHPNCRCAMTAITESLDEGRPILP